MIKISKRLKTIANLIESGSRVADIGTDHGLVPNFLIENDISPYLVASDISKDSLKKTYDLIDKKYIGSRIFLRVGNGLDIIKEDEVDTVIIAGLGGILISKIIEEDLNKVKKLKNLILQPMQNQDRLREYLYKKGFVFNDQRIVCEDKKYFEIMDVSYKGIVNDCNPIFYDLAYECYKRKDREFVDYLLYRIRKNEFILDKLSNAKLNKRIEDKKLEVKKANERYEKILCHIKSEK